MYVLQLTFTGQGEKIVKMKRFLIDAYSWDYTGQQADQNDDVTIQRDPRIVILSFDIFIFLRYCLNFYNLVKSVDTLGYTQFF